MKKGRSVEKMAIKERKKVEGKENVKRRKDNEADTARWIRR